MCCYNKNVQEMPTLCRSEHKGCWGILGQCLIDIRDHLGNVRSVSDNFLATFKKVVETLWEGDLPSPHFSEIPQMF
jgi:hypothetical protein